MDEQELYAKTKLGYKDFETSSLYSLVKAHIRASTAQDNFTMSILKEEITRRRNEAADNKGS